MLEDNLARGFEAKAQIHALEEASEVGEDVFGDLLVNVVNIHDELSSLVRQLLAERKTIWQDAYGQGVEDQHTADMEPMGYYIAPARDNPYE